MERRTDGASRRDAMLMIGSAALIPAVARAQSGAPAARPAAEPAATSARPPLTLVSRHLQWASVEEGIDVAREAGFPAIAWTVRPGAHIEPADVERELPRVVDLTRKAGLDVPMIITQIGDVGAPRAEAILTTMRGLRISRYRAGSARYDLAQPVEPQLDAFKARLAALAELNERLGTLAMVHTHSRGHQIGGSGWDMWLAVKDLDPRFVGINFDVGHVTAKGGDGLLESIRAARTHVHAISVKDFVWRRKPSPAAEEWAWETHFVPPGEGMVNFRDIFRFLVESSFNGPLETYFEYEVEVPGRDQPVDMLGTDFGKWNLEMPRAQFVGLLQRDVGFYRHLMRATGLAA